MPVTEKASVVVWDRISSFDAERKDGEDKDENQGEEGQEK